MVSGFISSDIIMLSLGAMLSLGIMLSLGFMDSEVIIDSDDFSIFSMVVLSLDDPVESLLLHAVSPKAAMPMDAAVMAKRIFFCMNCSILYVMPRSVRDAPSTTERWVTSDCTGLCDVHHVCMRQSERPVGSVMLGVPIPITKEEAQTMWELAAIGLIGGVVTGISPCILPVLPVVLAVTTGERARPFRVVAGIALSFSAITLLGTVVLGALGLPTGILRWVGITLLVLVGLGMIVPQLGHLVDKPFEYLPRPVFLQNKARGRGGFVVGMALGAVYVPCAGPVLAAVTVAGATGDIGWSTVVLTVAFALGASAPLLVFALAGNKIGERIDAAQKNRTIMRGAAGSVVLVLALALAIDAPARIQRALPDWTASAQRSLGDNSQVQEALGAVRNGTSKSGHRQRLLVAAHSFGSLLAFTAAASPGGLEADGLLAMGSPGAAVLHKSQLNLHATDGDPEVYAVTGSRDWISMLGSAFGGYHGADPSDALFGAERWPSESDHDYWKDESFLKRVGEAANAR